MDTRRCVYCGSEDIEPTDGGYPYFCNNCRRYLDEDEVTED